VVYAGTPACEKLAYRGVPAEGGEQLDAAAADEHRRRFDALLRDRLSVLELGAEEPPVGVQGVVEVCDRNAEVVNAACLHRSRCYRQEATDRPGATEAPMGT
jgi:hypothetical protein